MVYHLHGFARTETMVLTEDDYLEFLTNMAAGSLDWVYVDEPAWARPRSQELVQELASDPTWQRMTPASASTEHCVLLRRQRSVGPNIP